MRSVLILVLFDYWTTIPKACYIKEANLNAGLTHYKLLIWSIFLFQINLYLLLARHSFIEYPLATT